MLKLLHINNSFPTNSVFDYIFKNLENSKLEQTVFSPVRSEDDFFKLKNRDFIYKVFHPRLIYPFHKIFFRAKIQSFFKFLSLNLELYKFNIVHAHTLYTDGFLAYEIFDKYNIPYILSIRKTDLNVFEKYRPDLKKRRNLVLKYSKAIIFLTPVYQERYFNLLNSELLEIVRQKSYIISNPLSSFWLKNRINFSFRNINGLSVLYVGNNSKNKNLKSLISAIDKLSLRFPIDLYVVGVSVPSSIKKFNNNIHFVGYLSDLESLRNFYRKADIFCVPSFNETFGMVYLEALSQGVPVLFSHSEGISGLFNENFVYSINPYSVDSIVDGIIHYKNMIENNIPFDSNIVLNNFSEESISSKLFKLYLS